ncbi:MAG: hypothetical protein K8F30_02840 [Taibaiella sp.]|nr:hypothetical protein [Taibaiella sp.]
MTKIVGFCALHYGADYLEYALRSIVDYVDVLHVVYTPQPSHGTGTTLTCPDTYEKLAAITTGVSYKVHWHSGVYRSESEHRAQIYKLEPAADVIVVVDSDEIWSKLAIWNAIEQSHDIKDFNHIRIPMWHYWRSFKRGFMNDPANPIRIILPKNPQRDRSLIDIHHANKFRAGPVVMHHFGYAQRSDIVRYKMQIHGHIGEFRRDVNWFNDVFMANRQVDCHPVGSEYWNAEPIPDSALPAILDNHPYRHLELIP